MAAAGYRLVETHDVVHGHWFGIFRADAGTDGDER
jgi:hypothetical protein